VTARCSSPHPSAPLQFVDPSKYPLRPDHKDMVEVFDRDPSRHRSRRGQGRPPAVRELQHHRHRKGLDAQPQRNASYDAVMTPCRFGGERPWFVCGIHATGVYCGRKVVKLYGAGRLFACRHCYRLGYAIQQDGPMDRAHHRLRRLHRKLGADYDGPDGMPPGRPKWMTNWSGAEGCDDEHLAVTRDARAQLQLRDHALQCPPSWRAVAYREKLRHDATGYQTPEHLGRRSPATADR
jgi:hypothetical protein